MMCSYEIVQANSCYIDNWELIINYFQTVVVYAFILGVTVGIINKFLTK